MTKLPYILAAIVIGATVAMQPGLNAEVSRRIGSAFGAAFISITVAFVLSLAFLLISRQSVSWTAAAGMPWYLWLAGSIGLIFVAGALVVAPVLGGALLFACIVAGQMIGATLADHFGFAGYQVHSFDPWRIVGIVLVLAGVLAFQRAG